MRDFLFDDFDVLTPAAWKQKIQVDLKGADYMTLFYGKLMKE